MFTHKDYMDKKVSHREYFAQFVNREVIAAVKRKIGLPALLASKDEHLNDIPLRKWDILAGAYYPSVHSAEPVYPRSSGLVSSKTLQKAGEGISLGTLVCIYKEAAKQLIESERKKKCKQS